MQVGSVGRVQHPAATVLGIGVVISHTFAAQVVVGTENRPGNSLRPALIETVMVRRSRVMGQVVCHRGTNDRGGKEDDEDEERRSRVGQ